MYSLLNRCKSDAAFMARAERGRIPPLSSVFRVLSGDGHRLLVDAGVLLVIESPEGVEYSLFESGKVILKTDDRDAAARVVEALERAIDCLDA